MAQLMRARFVGTGPAAHDALLFQTFYRPSTIGGSTSDATDILAKVRVFLQANISKLYSGLTYRAQLNVDVIDDATGDLVNSWSGADPGNVVGTDTSDPLPATTSWIIRWNTATVLRGRFVKGRTFLGIPGEAQSVAPQGLPFPSSVTAMQTAANALVTGFSTGTQMVVWARPVRDPVTHSIITSGTNAPIVSAIVRGDGWGSQRRRRIGF